MAFDYDSDLAVESGDRWPFAPGQKLVGGQLSATYSRGDSSPPAGSQSVDAVSTRLE